MVLDMGVVKASWVGLGEDDQKVKGELLGWDKALFTSILVVFGHDARRWCVGYWDGGRLAMGCL